MCRSVLVKGLSNTLLEVLRGAYENEKPRPSGRFFPSWSKTLGSHGEGYNIKSGEVVNASGFMVFLPVRRERLFEAMPHNHLRMKLCFVRFSLTHKEGRLPSSQHLRLAFGQKSQSTPLRR